MNRIVSMLQKIKNLMKNFEQSCFADAQDLMLFICSGDALPEPLSAEEEGVLLEEAQSGSGVARDKLVEHNLRLVVYIAKKFLSTGLEFEDLISIGAIGLIKAVKTFNNSKNIKLATYASRCIENEILMQLRKSSRQKNEVSLEEPLSFDGSGNELLLSDLLFDENANVDKDLEASADKQILMQSINKLNSREQKIMKMRFGLEGQDELTQKEVAEALGISQSYISRIEKKILIKIKNDLIKASSLG